MLYLVSTPIGNLKDITLRALETLQLVDGIICEDTRRTRILLDHYQIRKPLYVLNDFNEAKVYPRYIQMLQQGQNLALVSDAGTPLISDPGYKLVRTAFFEKITLDAIPGPSAVIDALTLSSFPPQKFFFLHFLPEKRKAREELLWSLKAIAQCQSFTAIIFVSPYKLVITLEDIHLIMGNREIVLAHELTKIHQSVDRKFASDWLEYFKSHKPKGEYVLLLNLDLSSSPEVQKIAKESMWKINEAILEDIKKQSGKSKEIG